ncbi:hypothetical protein PIB30_004908 [Stylosanthes scabra]|uniref:Uncharacterized protein n=1 Tax=Stylosanthes scabra TaxID=79078 RepID=A0ABU6W788_9FABA|nr:hypothetical protein [Stylosanthes scabra]
MGEENEFVRGRRDPSDLFDVEIACVCSVFVVVNKLRKRTGIPLDLEDTEAETSTPSPVTQTPVISTPSLSESLSAMRMIPTPGSRVQSSETTETRSQRATPTQTTTGSEDPPPPEPDPMPWLPVNNPLPEGEEEDIAMEEEFAR